MRNTPSYLSANETLGHTQQIGQWNSGTGLGNYVPSGRKSVTAIETQGMEKFTMKALDNTTYIVWGSMSTKPIHPSPDRPSKRS